MNEQQAREYALDQMQQGKVDAAGANVLMVQIQGVRLVHNKLPMDIRKALNAAVKAGELGHLKKDGLKPEAYFHKNGLYKAREARGRHEYNTLQSLKLVAGFNPDMV